ncbi:MAG: GDSL-type esterase/lipase family protein [Pseudomonadota bacterium]
MFKKIILPVSLALNALFIGGIIFVAPKAISTFKSIERVITTFAERRINAMDVSRVDRADIVFLDDSITHEGMWDEYYPDHIAVNRGVGGDRVRQVIARFDNVAHMQPKKLFLMIGINDLNNGASTKSIIEQYEALFDLFKNDIPDTEIYIQSVLPTNEEWLFSIALNDVNTLNDYLISASQERGFQYIDVAALFVNESGYLDTAYSNDGIHLAGEAYKLWATLLDPYVNAQPLEAINSDMPN